MVPSHPRLIWKFKTRGKFLTPPAVLSRRVLIGDDRGKLTCLNLSDGRRRWDRNLYGAFLSGLLVGEGRVYGAVSRREVRYLDERSGIFGEQRKRRVEEEKGKVFCLDLNRGRKIWQRRFFHLIRSTPALGKRQLIFGCDNYKIYSLDLQRGTINWSFKAAAPIVSSPVICAGRVVFGTAAGRLYCLDLAEGKKVWDYQTGGEIVSSPAYLAGRIWFGSGDNYVYCLDLDTSRPHWKFKTDSPVDTACVIYKRNVYFATRKGKIYSLDGGDGELRWSYQARESIDYPPAISSDRLLFCSRRGVVECLNTSTGKLLWEYPTFHKESAAISLGGGYIFCALRDRYLYCLGEEKVMNKETRITNNEGRMQ